MFSVCLFFFFTSSDHSEKNPTSVEENLVDIILLKYHLNALQIIVFENRILFVYTKVIIISEIAL